MYASTGKLIRSKTLVAYPRMAQLEEKEKRKLCFVGESELLYDKKLEKYRDHDLSFDHMEPDDLSNKSYDIKPLPFDREGELD